MATSSSTAKPSAMVTLPRIGLGMAALGRPGYINLNRSSTFGNKDNRDISAMQDRANSVMDAIFTSRSSSTTTTMPWLDCARSYGLSEQFVGEYLRKKNVDPKDVYVSSKWGYTYVADWKVELEEGAPHEVKDHSVENFLKQIEETSTHVGEYINLYQVHSATFESGILTDKRVHSALHQCRTQRNWKIGLSVSGPNQDEILREAMKITVSDGGDECQLFDSVQCTYNVLEQRPSTALMEAHEAGLDIIIKEGLANGRALQHPKIIQIAEQMDNCTPDQIALACILAQPFQPRVLSGAVTPEQFVSNAAALDLADKMKVEGSKENGMMKEVMEGCVMESEEYWKERSALAWN